MGRKSLPFPGLMIAVNILGTLGHLVTYFVDLEVWSEGKIAAAIAVMTIHSYFSSGESAGLSGNLTGASASYYPFRIAGPSDLLTIILLMLQVHAQFP